MIPEWVDKKYIKMITTNQNDQEAKVKYPKVAARDQTDLEVAIQHFHQNTPEMLDALSIIHSIIDRCNNVPSEETSPSNDVKSEKYTYVTELQSIFNTQNRLLQEINLALQKLSQIV